MLVPILCFLRPDDVLSRATCATPTQVPAEIKAIDKARRGPYKKKKKGSDAMKVAKKLAKKPDSKTNKATVAKKPASKK